MILEQKDGVCSLESSKRLKELNVRQDSQWYWETLYHEKYDIVSCDDKSPVHSYYSAYTVAELGVLLPINIRNPRRREEVAAIGYAEC